MDKGQALHSFWSQFGIPAYDAFSVPDDAQFPYITYDASMDSFDNVIPATASVWYRTTSWAEPVKKAEEIAKAIVEMHPCTIAIDGGRMYITKGTPFAQRLGDESDDMIKRMLIMINIEFFTNY